MRLLYRDHVNIRLVRAEAGESETLLIVDDRVVNGRGVLHGGAMCTLLDSAISSAVRSALPEGQRAVTASITVNLLRPVPLGEQVSAHGHVVQVGRVLAFGCAEAMVGSAIVATASGLWRVSEASEAEYRPELGESEALKAAWSRLDLSRLQDVPPASVIVPGTARHHGFGLSEHGT